MSDDTKFTEAEHYTINYLTDLIKHKMIEYRKFDKFASNNEDMEELKDYPLILEAVVEEGIEENLEYLYSMYGEDEEEDEDEDEDEEEEEEED